jgi:hypothetical protein
VLCYRVSGATRIPPRLWHVEVTWKGKKDAYSCATVKLDRFYLHTNGDGASDGGFVATPGRFSESGTWGQDPGDSAEL